MNLPADITRCLGDGCESRETCLRFIHRDDDHPRLHYMQRGEFIDGQCVYSMPQPEPKDPTS